MRGYLILTLFLPFIYRLALEIFAGSYPLGFDSIAYFIPILVGFEKLSLIKVWGEAPLYHFLLVGLNSFLKNPTLTIKILSIILPSILGLSIYLLVKDIIKSSRKAATISLIVLFYFSTLRLTLDLHRNLLGLTMMFFTLWLLEKNSRFTLLPAALTSLSHLSIPPVLLILLFFKIKEKNIALPTIIVTFLFFASVLLARAGNVLFQHLLQTLIYTSPIQYPTGIKAVGLFLYLTFPILPFLFPAIYGKKYLEIKILFLFFIILSFLPGYVSMRYAIISSIMATILVALWCVEKGKYTSIALSLITTIFAIGYTFFPTNNPFPYFKQPFLWDESFLRITTTSVQQNTVPLSQVEDVRNVLKIAKNFDGIFLIHRAFLGYSLIENLPKEKILVVEEYENFSEKIEEIKNQNLKIYTIWWTPEKGWHGIKSLPQQFDIIYKSNDIALYVFKG